MEIAISYSVQDKHYWPKLEWVATAFRRIGCDVRLIHDRNNDTISRAFNECEFVIFGHKSLGGRWPNVGKAIENRTSPAIYWWFDLVAIRPGLPLEQQPLFAEKKWRKMFAECDICLVKERSMLGEYHNHDVNAIWFDQGVLSDYPQAEVVNPEYDLLVWGQAYPQRVRDVKAAIDAGYSVAWATSQPANIPEGVHRLPWTNPVDLPTLASKARCVLSCGVRNDVSGYWSDSFWMAVGMGNCVLRRATRGLPEGPYYVYRSEQELCNLLLATKKDSHQTEKIRRDASTWARTEHSLENRAKSLIQIVQAAKEAGTLRYQNKVK